MKTIKFARPTAAAFGIAALLASSQVFAADVISEEPPAPAAPMEEPPLNTWSGPYAGVTLGYNFAGDTTDDDFDNSIDSDGFLAGAFAGYNYQTGNIVVGGEADVGYSWADGENAGTAVDESWEGSLRARIGYSVTPGILVYATAGGAAKRIEVSDINGSDKQTLLGYTAGVGTDVKLTESVFGRVEYRYTDFGSESFDTGLGDRDIDHSDHAVRFGLGVKF